MYLCNGNNNNFVASYLDSITRIETGVAITTRMLPYKYGFCAKSTLNHKMLYNYHMKKRFVRDKNNILFGHIACYIVTCILQQAWTLKPPKSTSTSPE